MASFLCLLCDTTEERKPDAKGPGHLPFQPMLRAPGSPCLLPFSAIFTGLYKSQALPITQQLRTRSSIFIIFHHHFITLSSSIAQFLLRRRRHRGRSGCSRRAGESGCRRRERDCGREPARAAHSLRLMIEAAAAKKQSSIAPSQREGFARGVARSTDQKLVT